MAHRQQKPCCIIEKGSMNLDLHSLSESIYSTCAKHGFSLETRWIARKFNQVADDLSRIVDYDDYGVNPEFFAYIDSLYGPHSIDRFAN